MIHKILAYIVFPLERNMNIRVCFLLRVIKRHLTIKQILVNYFILQMSDQRLQLLFSNLKNGIAVWIKLEEQTELFF